MNLKISERLEMNFLDEVLISMDIICIDESRGRGEKDMINSSSLLIAMNVNPYWQSHFPFFVLTSFFPICSRYYVNFEMMNWNI
jgi:hypothetical protein